MRNFVKFIGKFLQEPVTILRTFIFPPLFFFFWVVFLALFSTLIFEEDSLGYIALWSLGSIVVFLLSVTLFLRGLDQVQYYLNLDNLGSRTEERKNEQKPEKSQDNDTYKILSVRSDSYSAEAELAKLVNRHMLKGWRVVGGQSTTGGRRNYEKITQAMERDLPEDDPEPYDENDWRESRAKELGIYNSEYCAEISTIFREIHDVMLELPEDDLGYPDSKFHGEEFGKGGIRWWPDSKTDNPAWLDKNMPEYECFSLLQEQNIYSLTHAMNCYWGNGNYLFFYAYFDPFKINWKLEDNNEEFGRKNYNLEKWRKGLDIGIENRINGIITENLSILENYYEEYIQMKREEYDENAWKDRPQWVLKNPENKSSQTKIKRLFALFDYYTG